MAGCAVIDVLADLCGDASGEIGVDAGDEGRRDHRTALELIERLLRHDLVREVAELLDVGIEEVLLGALPVRIENLRISPFRPACSAAPYRSAAEPLRAVVAAARRTTRRGRRRTAMSPTSTTRSRRAGR